MNVAVALHSAAPTFDEAAICSHVALLHKRAKGANGLLVVSAFHVDPDNPADQKGRPGAVNHHRVGDVDGTVRSIMGHAATPHLNCYLGLQVMKPGIKRGKRGGRDDIVAMLGLVADLDGDTGKAGGLPCDPSYAIESSPGNRQPVWLFASPVTPEEAAPLAAALRRATDSDDGTSDIAHIWRIAGTLNWPNGAKIARGRSREPVAVTLADPFQGLVYDAAALAGTLEPHMRPTAAARSAKASGEARDASALYGQLSARALEKLGADVAEGERSEHAFTVYEQLEFDGLDLDDAIALVREYGGTWKDRYKSDDALVKDAERCWGKVDRSQQRAEAAAGVAHILQGDAAGACVREAANENEPPAEGDDDLAEETAGPWFEDLTEVDPFAIADEKGLLGDIARWVYAASWLPVFEFAILSAIAACAAIFGRRFVTPTGLGLNLYIIGIAPSGAGKDDPVTAPQELFTECGLLHLVGPSDVTSDGAIETAIRRNPCHLMAMDEIGYFLQGVNATRAAGHEKKVRKVLLDIYAKSRINKSWNGKTYSDPTGKEKKKDPVRNPTVTVFGVSVAESFYAGLAADNLTDGVLARLLVIEADSPRMRNPDYQPDVPEKLVQSVKYAASAAVGAFEDIEHVNCMVATMRPNLRPVPWTVKAEKVWGAIQQRQIELLADNPSFNGIINRAAGHTLVLATIRALGENPDDPIVKLADIQWGFAIVLKSLETIRAGITDHMAGSDFEALCLAVRREVKATTEEGITHTQLLRKKGISKAADKDVAGAIKRCVDTKQITLRESKRGRRGKRYFDPKYPPEAA
jgi:hypothetical protein